MTNNREPDTPSLPAPAGEPLQGGRWTELRQQAQARLEQTGATGPLPDDPPDLPHLLEELRTHQVELEIQNEELRQAQFRAELASSRYQLLFECLPQPALVMDEHGFVQDMNLAARQWLTPNDEQLRPPPATTLLRALTLAGRSQLFKALRAEHRLQAKCLCNLSLTTHSGQLRHIDLHLLSLPPAYHSDARFLVLLTDRTPEK
ncbi:MAG: hypothetical protein KA195_08420, partial [Burkholderiaceae bacterium]|nr:hypothetical protein [Burkholderiaceae bacterium]